jgi:hypothetical protein
MPHQFIAKGRTRDEGKPWAGTKKTGVSFGQFNRLVSSDSALQRKAFGELFNTDETISGVTAFLDKLRKNQAMNVRGLLSSDDKALAADWLLNVQSLAKSMEGHKISDKDIERYKQMIKGQLHWYQLLEGSNLPAVQAMIDTQMRIQQRQVSKYLTPESSAYFLKHQKEYYQPTVGLLPKEVGNIPAATDRAIEQGGLMMPLTVSAEMLAETEASIRKEHPGGTTAAKTGKKPFYTRDDAIGVLQKAIEAIDRLAVDPKHDASLTGIEKQTEPWQVPGAPPTGEVAFRKGGPALKGMKSAQTNLEVHKALVKRKLGNYIMRAVAVGKLDALMEKQGHPPQAKKSIWPPGYHGNLRWGKENERKIWEAYSKAKRKAKAEFRRTDRIKKMEPGVLPKKSPPGRFYGKF